MADVIRIPNIENYTQEIINGELILTPKKQYITEEELRRVQLAHSVIKECIIKQDDEIISATKTYRSIIVDIWKSMPTQLILQNTTFNFKLTNENGKKGYHWCDEVHMSFQGKDSKGTLVEILKMANLNNLNVELSILLETGALIHFRRVQILN